MADEADTGLTQAWVFGHRLLPKAAFSSQRRFLAKLRSSKAPEVLAGLWALAGKQCADSTPDLPPDVRVVRDERLGPIELLVVQLPRPAGPGTHFVALMFSEFEGKYADEVEAGTQVLTWGDDGKGAMLRFIGAAGFVPERPGSSSTSIARGGTLGFYGDDLGLDAFVRVVRQRYEKPSFLSRVRRLLGR